MNLLIVDDDLTNLKLLRAQLESEGHTVFEAHDGVDALALLERQRVDSVISDILMPRMDGYQLCHEIRESARLRGLPIVIYSSTYTAPDDEKLALEMGANKYLKKPASAATIVATLHEVIAQPYAAPRPDVLREVEVLKNYNERLVSKLKEKNTELMAAEVKFRSLVEQSGVGIYIVQDDLIVYVNPRMTEIFGWSEEEITSRTVYDFIVPEDHALVRENLRNGTSGPVARDHYHLRMLHQSGAVLEIEAYTSRTDHNGRPAMMGTLLDITERKAAEIRLNRIVTALRESEGKFQDFSDLASDWYWEQDADLRFTSGGAGSRSGSKVKVKDRESPIGKLRWDLNDTSRNPEQWEDHKRTVLAHEPFRDFRFEQTDENGQTRHVSVSGVPMHDQNGVFTGYRGIGRDITAQIEAELNLREAKEHAERAEALLQEAIDSVAEGFVICDTDGRHVLCNEGYRRFYQYLTGSTWAPGSTSEEILRRGLASGRYPDAIGRDRAWRDDWLRRSLEVPSLTERLLADGRWVLVTKRRLRSSGNVMLMMDITAIKQAQAALSGSEARLERAQEIAQIGSWEMDVATGAVVWSKEIYRMRGLPFDYKPSVATPASHLHPADVQPRLDWFADLSAGRKREPLEIRIMNPDGKERVNLIEGRPVVDADGVIRHVVGTVQDITERRLIERTLSQSQKMDALGQLTGGMAHDFNNMLGVIVGNLDLVKPLLGANALAGELCAEARDGAVRCADLIRRLLAFARRQSLRPEQTDVNALVSDVSHMLGRTLGEHIALALDLDATLWPVKVDPAQLEAALVNLATNARDAMPKGGQLTIITRNTTLDAVYTARHPDVSAGDYALIEVSDTGTGIPPEIITRIFEPFFTTKAPGKGTGLGLAMAFGFVKQSGGNLSVYSEPGLGTTFRLYLPRSDSDEAAAASAPSSNVVVGGDETVLVVEDNAQLRRTAKRQLTELGYKVREADSAQPALTILAGTEAVDLLFTDMVMPGTMDGLDLAYRAKRLRPGLKVLLTSGFPGGRCSDQRVAESRFSLLGKPYSLMQLAQAVRMVLDNGANGTAPAAGPEPPGRR